MTNTYPVKALLCLAAVVPFMPGTLEFFNRGIPDILFTGDGAALEFGTLHAAHTAQLLGQTDRLRVFSPGPEVIDCQQRREISERRHAKL